MATYTLYNRKITNIISKQITFFKAKKSISLSIHFRIKRRQQQMFLQALKISTPSH